MKKYVHSHSLKRKKIADRKRYFFLKALTIVFLITTISLYIAEIPLLKRWQISPLIIGMLLGIALFYPVHRQKRYAKGIHFCSKTILRLGIILYGFRISLNELAGVGIAGFLSSLIVVVFIYIVAMLIGKYVLKIDNETTILVGSGSAICGAAAVLAVESSLHLPAYKSGVAVATVLLYGMLAMFLYPVIYQLGIIPFSDYWEGVYIGSTVHEVAQVVAASSAISPETQQIAVIVKIIRVILLIPVLFVLPFMMKYKKTFHHQKNKMTIPWFALLFLMAIVVNSFLIYKFHDLQIFHQCIQLADTFILTMAMTALGLSIDIKKMIRTGGKAFSLAGILFLILLIGGFGLVYFISNICKL